jgi:L-cysteine S-thiosulfotransferase
VVSSLDEESNMRSVTKLIGLPVLFASLVWSGAGLSGDFPADFAVNPAAVNMTLEPKVVVNSGRLEWVPFKRDLTQWPSLSYDDLRPTPKPRKVTLEEPLNGNPARGREIALARDKGYCIVCHELPGEAWPGTVGARVLNFKKHNYPNELVFQQIFDARAFNPNSVMPPYGTFGILNEQEIRDLVAYLQSLD